MKRNDRKKENVSFNYCQLNGELAALVHHSGCRCCFSYFVVFRNESIATLFNRSVCSRNTMLDAFFLGFDSTTVFFFKKNQIVSTEPIGSVAPKVTNADKLNFESIDESHTMSLLCPIQSYPTPAYR